MDIAQQNFKAAIMEDEGREKKRNAVKALAELGSPTTPLANRLMTRKTLRSKSPDSPQKTIASVGDMGDVTAALAST